VTLTLTDCETGESTAVQCPGYAEEPKSDKSLWKAITGSSKYILRSFFCLATTDDPEQEDDQVQSPSKPSNNNVKPTKLATATNNRSIAVTSIEPPHSQDIPAADNNSPPTTLEQTSLEMERVGWTATEGRQFLERTFGKRGRKELTASELHQFLSHLLELPSMSARAPSAMAS